MEAKAAVTDAEGFLTSLAELVSALAGAYVALDMLSHGELTARVKAFIERRRARTLPGYDPVAGEAYVMGQVREALEEADAKGGTT